jgi:hypothetical protein
MIEWALLSFLFFIILNSVYVFFSIFIYQTIINQKQLNLIKK